MTTAASPVVIGIFQDRTLAEQAIEDLRQSGWMKNDVQVIGKGSGGVLDALKNAFAVRAPAEEVGLEELQKIDLPTEQRDFYQREVEQGSTLVLAYPDGHVLETRDILHQNGATNVFAPFQLGEDRTVYLRQEVPHIDKYVTDVGEIRIHKKVIIEQKTFTIPVRREEVTIERIPAQPSSPQVSPMAYPGPPAQPDYSRPPQNSAQAGYPVPPQNSAQPGYPVPPQNSAQTGYPIPPQNPAQTGYPPLNTAGGAEAFANDEVLQDGGTLRIRVRTEEVLFQKRPVIVEEIVIHKQMVQETRQLIEPIRHEEARIEQIGNVRIRESSTAETSERVDSANPQSPLT